MISYYGENLNLVISCEHLPGHNWMSYLCWRSIKNCLPDANVFIICKRNNVTGNLFLWAKKLNIFFKMYNEDNYLKTLNNISLPIIVLPPYCLALRDFEECNLDPNKEIKNKINYLKETKLFCDSRGDDFNVFCSYKEGWGNFNTNNWLNKIESPLSRLFIKRLEKNQMSLNEVKIKNFWLDSAPLFQAISGGIVL